ncbi:MAG: hypothetical protein Q8L01_01075, partial [Candidatus Woesebacteria bacterium]|nr:hypothetical protein [Candidatus Woesebacteria bacterium]
AGSIAILSIFVASSSQFISWEYAVVIIVCSIIWLAVAIYSDEYQFSIVNFEYIEGKPNFIDRNKDQIIVGIIVAVIAVLATLFFQNLFK